MLDTPSLRVAFGVVALTMLTLFYFVTYRSTRSAYSAWWCASLALFVPGASLYLFNGTVNQVWANPLANVIVVAGAGCVWAGARSLWTASPPWWQVGAGPALVGVFSAIDEPATNIWAGGPFYLGAMWVLLGMAATELFRQAAGLLAGADVGQRHLPARSAVDDRRLRAGGGLLLRQVGGLHRGGLDRPAVLDLVRRPGHDPDLDGAAGHRLVQHVDAQQRAADRGPARERRPGRSHRPAQPHRVPPARDRRGPRDAQERRRVPAHPGRPRPLQADQRRAGSPRGRPSHRHVRRRLHRLGADLRPGRTVRRRGVHHPARRGERGPGHPGHRRHRRRHARKQPSARRSGCPR